MSHQRSRSKRALDDRLCKEAQIALAQHDDRPIVHLAAAHIPRARARDNRSLCGRRSDQNELAWGVHPSHTTRIVCSVCLAAWNAIQDQLEIDRAEMEKHPERARAWRPSSSDLPCAPLRAGPRMDSDPTDLLEPLYDGPILEMQGDIAIWQRGTGSEIHLEGGEGSGKTFCRRALTIGDLYFAVHPINTTRPVCSMCSTSFAGLQRSPHRQEAQRRYLDNARKLIGADVQFQSWRSSLPDPRAAERQNMTVPEMRAALRGPEKNPARQVLTLEEIRRKYGSPDPRDVN